MRDEGFGGSGAAVLFPGEVWGGVSTTAGTWRHGWRQQDSDGTTSLLLQGFEAGPRGDGNVIVTAREPSKVTAVWEGSRTSLHHSPREGLPRKASAALVREVGKRTVGFIHSLTAARATGQYLGTRSHPTPCLGFGTLALQLDASAHLSPMRSWGRA